MGTNKASKRVLILVGPKGSGKTYIGLLVAQHSDIHFLQVELLWINLQKREDGWLKVETKIDQLLTEHDTVMIESLGGSDGFDRLHASLKGKYDVKFIRIYADLDTCLTRVRTRDQSGHISISDDKVQAYNRLAAQVELDWSLEIDNNEPASVQTILTAIGTL